MNFGQIKPAVIFKPLAPVATPNQTTVLTEKPPIVPQQPETVRPTIATVPPAMTGQVQSSQAPLLAMPPKPMNWTLVLIGAGVAAAVLLEILRLPHPAYWLRRR